MQSRANLQIYNYIHVRILVAQQSLVYQNSCDKQEVITGHFRVFLMIAVFCIPTELPDETIPKETPENR